MCGVTPQFNPNEVKSLPYQKDAELDIPRRVWVFLFLGF